EPSAVSFEGRAGNPRTLRGSAAGRSPPEEGVHKQSETPTVKSAGVFTIANFDKQQQPQARSQPVYSPAGTPSPCPQSVRAARPHPPRAPDQVRAGRCSQYLLGYPACGAGQPNPA